ncbi:MAG: hypothetical protein CL666_08685 [Balneola sp.]|nr:hypothetical protein [Balneola sp.]|tara:strand:+ start:15672 stop:16133 length:462 start_codon:yes stop_codon:yes gene_type:complete
MSTLKNIHYLNLSEQDKKNLDKSAGMYAANANITFKVLKVDDDELVIEVRQGKNASDKYQNTSGLVDRGKKLFSHFYPDHDIHIRPKPYQRPPADNVTPEWIQKRMNDRKISLKQIEGTTSIDKTNLSAWINGKRPMSQPVKAMFYFMLKSNK